MIDTNPIEALETLTATLKKYKTNEEVLNRLLISATHEGLKIMTGTGVSSLVSSTENVS